MQYKLIRYCGRVAVGLLLVNSAHAFDMGNMMNPSKWMGGNHNDDRYDDYYGGGPGYGYPGGYGPGYGGVPGYGGIPGYGGVPGYGGDTGYGYATPAYGGNPGYGYTTTPGYGGAPGYGYSTPAYGGSPPASAPETNDNAKEIQRLKDRIRKLEEGGSAAPPPVWGQQGYEYR